MNLREQDVCAPILPDQVRLSVICFGNGFVGWLVKGQEGPDLVPGI